MHRHQWVTTSVTETQALAANMAQRVAILVHDKGFFITLEGDLGAGKTAFSQGFIQALLPEARVKSPTFSLIESYQTDRLNLHHLDLYRLQDPEELEYLGLRELFWHSICLIEWASRGEGWLPLADCAIHIAPLAGEHRQITLIAQSELGYQLLASLLESS
ncbi:MAG: tRNA (adenosine(37)-N6)-threonylcarbamoyltransferase complex ATPase subunit type 1 TsaE [Gammaproteobacteria bacterium]|nr:tRNA (adenosine(37)-N6)-threonylcarbamoyltransferase complex ATPase subunit type 1 TsaE [Gammaproteobacteria bacterium]